MSAATNQALSAPELAAKAGQEEINKVIGPYVKRILSAVDTLRRKYGELQNSMFAVIRQAPFLAKAEMYVRAVEIEICQHLELDPQTRLQEVDGLASWAVTKSRLLKGFSFRAVLPDGTKTEEFKLDPQDKRYDDYEEDGKVVAGSSIWLKDIDAKMNEAKEAWVKAQAEAKAKAEAQGQQERGAAGDSTSSTAMTPNRKVDGNDNDIVVKMPDDIKANFAALIRQVDEAVKAGLPSKVIAGRLDNCRANLAAEITSMKEQERKKAEGAGATHRPLSREVIEASKQAAVQAPELDEEEIEEALRDVSIPSQAHSNERLAASAE